MTIAEDIATIQTRLTAYRAAEAQLLSGNVQAYAIGNRQHTLLDLGMIQKMIRDLTASLRSLQSGNSLPTYQVVPVDY